MNPGNPSERMYLTVVMEDEDTEGLSCFVATHPELPGCMSQGRTRAEAVENLREARELYIQSLLDDGLPLPTPAHATTTTGGGSDRIIVSQPGQVVSCESRSLDQFTVPRVLTSEACL